MFSVICVGALWHLVKLCLSVGLRRAQEGLMFWLGISVFTFVFQKCFFSSTVSVPNATLKISLLSPEGLISLYNHCLLIKSIHLQREQKSSDEFRP